MNIELHSSRRERSQPGIFSFTLKMGSWKRIFRAGYYKTLIAEALNITVHKGEFRNTIAGYLISERRLCLVLHVEEKKVRKMLDRFYAHLREEISRSLEVLTIRERDQFRKEIDAFEHRTAALFSEYTLKNKALIRLITGRRAVALYPDANLQRLKDRLRNQPFCSTIDYKGGEGPVLVKLMKKKDWLMAEHAVS